jgi:hypothetical protein
MATRPTQLKNQRERALAARRKEKAMKRQESQTRPNVQRRPGEDPDIAHIVPGPQPHPFLEDEPDEKTE